MYYWYYGEMPACCYGYAASNQLHVEANGDETPQRIQRSAKGFPEGFFDWTPERVDRVLSVKRPGSLDHDDDENGQSLDDMISTTAQKSRIAMEGSATSDHEVIQSNRKPFK